MPGVPELILAACVIGGGAMIVFGVISAARNMKKCRAINDENISLQELNRSLLERAERLLTRIERIVERIEGADGAGPQN